MNPCRKCGGERASPGPCKKCRNAASLAWYYTHKDISDARSRANKPRQIANKNAIVAERGGGCEICGYRRHLGALDFHHVTSKSHILNQAHMHNVNSARAESNKCVLLCANCHREVHGGAVKIPQHVLDAAYTRYGEWISGG